MSRERELTPGEVKAVARTGRAEQAVLQAAEKLRASSTAVEASRATWIARLADLYAAVDDWMASR